MSHFKMKTKIYLALILTCFAQLAHSAEKDATAEPLTPVIHRSFSINYTTWVEQMTLANSATQANDFAQLIGIGLCFNRERFSRSSWGTLAEFTLLSGQANGGGSQTAIAYQKSHLNWSGAAASYRLAYRLTSSVLFSLGPIAIFRKISWPTDSADLTVQSGQDINFGALVEMKFLLNPHWQLIQSFGALQSKASSLWSLGLGYYY